MGESQVPDRAEIETFGITPGLDDSVIFDHPIVYYGRPSSLVETFT